MDNANSPEIVATFEIPADGIAYVVAKIHTGHSVCVRDTDAGEGFAFKIFPSANFADPKAAAVACASAIAAKANV